MLKTSPNNPAVAQNKVDLVVMRYQSEVGSDRFDRAAGDWFPDVMSITIKVALI